MKEQNPSGNNFSEDDYSFLPVEFERRNNLIRNLCAKLDELISLRYTGSRNEQGFFRWRQRKIMGKVDHIVKDSLINICVIAGWFERVPLDYLGDLSADLSGARRRVNIKVFKDFEEYEGFCKQYGEYNVVCIQSSCARLDNPRLINYILKNNHKALFFCWAVDHHHIYNHNLRLAQIFDVIIPGHHTRLGYLQAVNTNITRSVHCPIWQFTKAESSSFHLKYSRSTRKDSLYGRFSSYPQFNVRRKIINNIIKVIPSADVMQFRIDENGHYIDSNPFMMLSSEEKFAELSAYKVGLQVDARQDITSRIFESLLAGQVPIVPRSVVGLDHAISPALQRSLPVLTISDLSAEAVYKTYTRALERFDFEGAAGVIRRHVYATENHMPENRLLDIANCIIDFMDC